jgi:GntR family transcriptional regulator, rspAB operon transcriptional repressor
MLVGPELGLPPIEAKPRSLTELVLVRIRDAIATKTLPPGSRISEARLAAQLAVSKTPVREALMRLQEIGLVVPDGRRGTQVVQPSRALIEHAFEVRSALEGCAAYRAAVVAQPAAISELKSVAAASFTRAQTGDSDGFRVLDERFHLAVAVASKNDLLPRLIENAYTLAWALRQRDVPSIDHQVNCGLEHLVIADAIADHDAAAAAEHMARHIDASRLLILETMTKRYDPPSAPEAIGY